MKAILGICLLLGCCIIWINCLSLATISDCEDMAPSELCNDCIRYSHVCRRTCHVCSAKDEEDDQAENRVDVFRRELLKGIRNDRISRILRRQQEEERERIPSNRRDMPARYACSITGNCHNASPKL